MLQSFDELFIDLGFWSVDSICFKESEISSSPFSNAHENQRGAVSKFKTFQRFQS